MTTTTEKLAAALEPLLERLLEPFPAELRQAAGVRLKDMAAAGSNDVASRHGCQRHCEDLARDGRDKSLR